MVPSGSVLTYQAQCTTDGSFQTPNDVLSQVNQTLAQSGISVRDSAVSAGILDTILSPVNGALDFQLTLTLQTNADFNAISDIQGIADHGVYIATNQMPVSSIPNVTVPGSPTAAATGQPTQASPTAAVSGAGSWLGGILQGGVNSFALLMVGVILAVILIIAGKQRGILSA